MSDLSAIDALFKAVGPEGSLEDLKIAISTSVDLNALARQPCANPGKKKNLHLWFIIYL